MLRNDEILEDANICLPGQRQFLDFNPIFDGASRWAYALSFHNNLNMIRKSISECFAIKLDWLKTADTQGVKAKNLNRLSRKSIKLC